MLRKAVKEGMDEEDVGIGVDFDYCQYEEKFYEETYRRNGDSSDDDSALSVSSPRDPPPFRQQLRNHYRDEKCLRTFHPISLRRAELLSISAYQYRLRGDQWVLSEARLVTHLLDFMDLPAKQHRFVSRICTDTVDPPLFSVGDCGLEIDDRYSFPPTSFLCPIQKSYLRSLGETILPYHRHLVELCDFVNRLQVVGNVFTPPLVKEICAWVEEFLRDHAFEVDKLRRRLLKDTPRVLTCLYDQWQKVSLIYKVTASFLRRRTWKWEDVEEIWTSLFLLTSNQRLHPLPQREQLADLQKRCYEMLLRIMDSIYTLGKVPPGVADHFVLFNERRNGSDLLLCRNIEQANSPLWSRDLIETILAGSQTCVRLGTWEDKEKVFTAKFDEILDARKFSPRGQGIMPFSTFREVFNASAEALTNELSAELLEQLHCGNLFAQLWKDLEQVTIGEVAKQYASLVFTPHAAAGVFTDAFWLAMRHGVSSENQMRFSWIAEKAEFTCKIDSPLSYFVREEHIAVMNMCMRFVHAAHRTLETLVTISTDRSLIDRLSCMPSRNSSECSLNSSAVSITEHNNAFSEDDFSLRKRLRFVVFILKQIVSHFKEFFINKARWVYRTTLNKILTATSVAQAEKASVEAHSLLHQLVEKANFRKRVHEAMSLYVNITDVIRLRLVSNTLTLKYVDECEQKVLKSVEMLLMLSKHYGHDKDTIFYLLASRIGFKSQIYSFDSRMS